MFASLLFLMANFQDWIHDRKTGEWLFFTVIVGWAGAFSSYICEYCSWLPGKEPWKILAFPFLNLWLRKDEQLGYELVGNIYFIFQKLFHLLLVLYATNTLSPPSHSQVIWNIYAPWKERSMHLILSYLYMDYATSVCGKQSTSSKW